MKAIIKPVIFLLSVFAPVYLFPAAAFAPNVGDQLNALEEYQNILLVLFCLSGVLLCFINLMLAAKACPEISFKASCQTHGYLYAVLVLLSVLTAPEYISGNGVLLNHINFYFPAINWLLLFFWLVIGRFPEKATSLCKKASHLPVPWLGMVAYVILVLPPAAFAPFYLVSLFL